MMRFAFVLFISFVFSAPIFSQSKKLVDSLQKQLSAHPQKDTIRLHLLIELAWQMRNSHIAASFEYSQQALYLADEIKHEKALPKLYNHRGIYYRNISDYPEAERRFSDALKKAEQLNDKIELAYAYNNLGDLLRLTNNFTEGIKFMHKAKDIFVELKDQRGEAYTCIRLSEAYQKTNMFAESYQYAEKSLAIRKLLRNSADISASLNRIGDLLAVQEKFPEALKHYEEALSLANNNNDATSKVASLQDIGKVYTRTNRFAEADSVLRKALDIALKIGNREQESNVYEFFTELYEKQHRTEEAYHFYKRRQTIKDSVFSNQRMLQISQMRVRHDLRGKELENQTLQNQLEQEKMIRIIGILFFLVVLVGGIWIYRNSIKIKGANEELERKNEEIHSTLESLSNAHAAISQKNREIEFRNQEIEIKNQDLLNSIDYALTIQQAILPTHQQVSDVTKDYFIIWEPRDVISGDFYWVADKADKSILVVADCTGHGVPGALMSMMGNNLLNSVIHDKEIHQPDVILEYIHHALLETLHTERTQIINGMDMGICVYDKKASTMSFAGAGINLYYPMDGQIVTLDSDKTSVGNPHKLIEKFTLHQVCLKGEQTFFMASDGYKDQFGGENNKKFGIKQFKQMLQDIHHMDIRNQKTTMLRQLYLWLRDCPEGQTDDITVLGFQI